MSTTEEKTINYHAFVDEELGKMGLKMGLITEDLMKVTEEILKVHQRFI